MPSEPHTEELAPGTMQVDINLVLQSLQRQLGLQSMEIAQKDAMIATYQGELEALKQQIDTLAASLPTPEPEDDDPEPPHEDPKTTSKRSKAASNGRG